MKLYPLILIVLLIFLPACISTDSMQDKNDEYSDEIRQQEFYMTEQGVGAAIATKIILERSRHSDIYIESAKKTINLSVAAMPDLTLEEMARWESIADGLIEGSESGLQKKEKELIRSEKEKIKLKKKLEEGELKLLDVYARMQDEHSNRIEELKRDQALKKDLVRYFFYAAAAATVVGGILTYVIGFKIGLNSFIAAGFFSLAAYLVATPFFAYIAAGMAVIMFVGTIYYMCGEWIPKSTLKRQIQVVERMENSRDARARDAAKMFKSQMKSSLEESKTQKRHRKLVRRLKN